jgi:hypothetical protein
MNKLGLALILALLGLAPAQAQNVSNPTSTAPSGAYNASPPTCTDGKFCLLQTDVNGKLLVSGSGGGSGGSVTQGTSPWVISGAVTGTFWQTTQPVSGTFWQTTQPVSGTVTTAPATGVTQAKTAAAASSLVAKGSAGSVVSISGSAIAGSYIMLFNATAAPSNGAVTPDKCWGPMAAAGPFNFSWGIGPVFTASTGITVVSSSTGCFTQTLTNASFIAVEYQ